MSKKIYADEIQEKEDEQKLYKKHPKPEVNKQEKKEESDTPGASGFSDDVEKKFQEKNKSKMAKFHNLVSKGINPLRLPKQIIKEDGLI